MCMGASCHFPNWSAFEMDITGRLQEQVVTLEDARRATGGAFINSLRGWLDARLLG